MKIQKYIVTIEMPDGDTISPSWLKYFIQTACDVEECDRQKVSVEEFSKPELPSNLDEAAEEYANKEFPDEPSCGQWGTGDYEPFVDMSYPREIAKDYFKAGAEWMTRQGISCECEITKDFGISFLKEPFEKSAREMEGNVVVQIRKR